MENLTNSESSTEKIGGLTVDVVITPRIFYKEKSTNGPTLVWSILRALLNGMRITFKYLSHPSTVVTQQYPENRESLKMLDRFRSRLVFIYEQDGSHHCTGCRICETVCPNKSILIDTMKGTVTGKTEIDQFIWRWDICTFCNACVQACPHGAIEMAKDFESAVYDRRLLVMNLNSYAGPPTKVLEKMSEEDRNKAREFRPVYSGKIPMNGFALDGVQIVQQEKANVE
ncbi:MAG: 4Fe-4S binding protein [SAR324 cluster bacterium]|nr:4Fe-4S binding protein [SAR324 cluster bacterium]